MRCPNGSASRGGHRESRNTSVGTGVLAPASILGYTVLPVGMAVEQKSFWINSGTEEGAVAYLDTAAALSAANSKQYHQFAKNGTPMCYRIMVTQTSGSKHSNIFAAANNWRVRNACKMFAAGWKAQLKHAGIHLKDLPVYGRRPRVALEAGGAAAKTLGGKTFTELAKNYQPLMAENSSVWFTGYTDTAGNTVTYDIANTIVEVAVTDASGTATEEYGCVAGSSMGAPFQIVNQYNASRRSPQTLETDAPGPSTDSDMLKLFSIAEELSDDIVEAIDDYGDWRPYNTEANSEKVIQVATTDFPQSTQSYPSSSVIVEAPLGLLKIEPQQWSTATDYHIEVLAIYEM